MLFFQPNKLLYHLGLEIGELKFILNLTQRKSIDPKGSFFGSDVAGPGGNKILASGVHANEVAHEASCPYAAKLCQGAFSCDKHYMITHLLQPQDMCEWFYNFFKHSEASAKTGHIGRVLRLQLIMVKLSNL